MACCLTAPSHYSISITWTCCEVMWPSPQRNFIGNAHDIYPLYDRGQGVKESMFGSWYHMLWYNDFWPLLQCSAIIKWSIFLKIQMTPHISPARARYGLSLVGSYSDLYSASVTAVMYAISCHIWQRNNGTWLIMFQIWTEHKCFEGKGQLSILSKTSQCQRPTHSTKDLINEILWNIFLF